jgi:hypothetical protein
MLRHSRSPQADEGPQAGPFEAASASQMADPAPPVERAGVPARTGATVLRKPMEMILIKPLPDKKNKKNKLTLLAGRFYNALLIHAQENRVKSGKYFQIGLAQFQHATKYDSRNIEHLTNVLNDMLSTPINWGDSPKTLDRQLPWKREGRSLISYWAIEKQPGGPTILSFDIGDELLDLLLDRKAYAKINIELAATMNTYAALQLLQICEQYKTLKGATPDKDGLSRSMHWREWVPYLTGDATCPPALQFKYFARDTLRPAVEQVNKAQDEFEVDYITTKQGRFIDKLQFQVKPKRPADTAPRDRLNEVGVDSLDLVGRLIHLKLQQHTAETLIVDFGPRRVRAALRELEPRVQAGTVKNTLAYLKTLLRSGDLQEEQGDEQSGTVHDVEAKRLEAPSPVGKPVLASLRVAYTKEMREKHYELFLREYPPEDQQDALTRFESEKLPQLSEALHRPWNAWKEKAAQKEPVPPILRSVFGEWLAQEDLKASDDTVLNWALAAGRIDISA